MKHGKKYVDSAKTIEAAKLYEVNEAIDIVLNTAKAKFDETLELHVRLGVDPKQADQQVRGVLVLPNGTGKNVRVLVLAKGEKADQAKEAGADFVGAEEMIQKIQSENWFDYDVIITTPDMMGLVGRIGKVLGPKGLMPNPKSGTVTMDVVKAIKDTKAGKVEYRLDKNAIIHCAIGKKSFGLEKLKENYEALMEAIVKAKPAAAKGQYVKSVALASTMGPGFSEVLQEKRHSSNLPEIGIERAYNGLSSNTFNITISHIPQLWDNITELGMADLTLSGHVHAMQIKLPIGKRGISPSQIMHKRWSGLYEERGRWLYINDGIGCAMWPMRIGVRPEITVIELVTAPHN